MRTRIETDERPKHPEHVACRNCVYYAGAGECARFPVRPIEVFATAFCGEWIDWRTGVRYLEALDAAKRRSRSRGR